MMMDSAKILKIILRGGGDLASGVALRLWRAGLQVVMTELPEPLVVRRRVSFAEAVYAGQATVEEVHASLVESLDQMKMALHQREIPVLVDPQAAILLALRAANPDGMPVVLVDGRMTKQPPENSLHLADLMIGLGPGFIAGENCHAVVETNRGHRLGRVIWQGGAQADTGFPESVQARGLERVLRSPADGALVAHAEIGDHLEAGQLVAEVAGLPVMAPFRGTLRGLIYPGRQVWRGLKIGDVDPRDDPQCCILVSEKALAIGGGVLEAILSRPELRPYLWNLHAPD